MWTDSVLYNVGAVSRPATRVLALLEVLQDRGLVPATELADRLGVDARTVRRYATALRELDIPVQAVRGRYGGYRLARGYRLPPLMLSDDEAVAVAVALASAGEREEAGEPSPTQRALLKLNRVLPAALRERVGALDATTSVVGRRHPAPDPEPTLTLAAATRNRHRVRLTHARAGAGPTTRDVDPYGLVVHAGRWYLVGHDHLRGEVRIFRLDRVTDVAELQRHFVPPDGFDPVAHVLHALTIGAWRHRTEVWLDVDAAEARRRLPVTIGELSPDPAGGAVLTTGVEDLDGMARMLCGLPWDFRVLGPPELADAVRTHVAHLTGYVSAPRDGAET